MGTQLRSATNIEEVLRPVTDALESYRPKPVDPVIEYQRYYMRMKQLVREAEYAKETGQWKKSQDLLFEVCRMTNDYCNKRVSR